MKPIQLSILLVILLYSTAAKSQVVNNIKVTEAEQKFSTFYSTVTFKNHLNSKYQCSELEFKLKNRSLVYYMRHEIIDLYVNNQFNFDTVGQYVFNYLEAHKLELNLKSTSTISEKNNPLTTPSGTPLITTRAANGPCVNMDFESGDLTGWEMYEGFVNGNPAEMTGSNQLTAPGIHHTIMTGGQDPIVPISTINPNGGNSSLRLGDGTGAGGRAASVRQTFLVDNSNAVFTYSYAVVLEDPSGHSLGEKPFFQVNLYDENGNVIPCGQYQVVASSNLDPSWNSYGGGWYRDWETVFAPLNNYIGQNVTIEFISGDCDQGGHYGYAYIDAECSPLELIPPGTLICDGNPVTLSAPAGAATYSWSSGETTQTITTSTPGNYSCTVTPIQGSSCSVTLNATVGGSTGAPNAAFNAVPTSVCAGEVINFTDNSTATSGATVDYWDYNFMDGSVNASTPNATHSYVTAGSYDVQFVAGVLVSGQGGCYDTVVQTITVNDPPVADFTVTSACENGLNSFTDASTGVVTAHNWDFESDNIIDNTTVNPNNVYPSAGTYTATLIATSSGGCSDTVSKIVIVNPNPIAQFTTHDACFGEDINFTESSTISTGNITNYQWDFGDLTGSSFLQNTTYNYTATGTYTVSFTVTSDSGCINNSTTQVAVHEIPTASFTIADECLGALSTFVDNSTGNGGVINQWEYDFENDGTVDNTSSTPGYIYPASGSVNTLLTVTTQNGCTDDTIIAHTIFETPTASFTFTNECVNDNITFIDNSIGGSSAISSYFWEFGNGMSSGLSSPNNTYTAEGIYNVNLTITNAEGCSDMVFQAVEVYPAPNVLFFTNNACNGNNATFSDITQVSNAFTSNNITQWSWDFGDALPGTSTVQNPSYLYDNVGTYTVTLTTTTNNGCTSSGTADVTIYPNPVVDFSSPNPDGCAVWCADFVNNSSITSGSLQSYYWNFGNGYTSLDENPQACFENPTTSILQYPVSLTAVSDQGCSSELTQSNFITVYPIPIADFGADPYVTNIYNTTVQFSDSSVITNMLNWNFGGLGNSNDLNPAFTFPDVDSGNYEVCLDVTSQYGCTDDTCKIIIVEGVSNIYVPNAFSPNGNGVNDFFGPSLYGISEEGYQFMIFDRWGLLIFETTDLNQMWDGRYKGTIVQQDAYVWKIKAKDKYQGSEINKTGHVTVLSKNK